MFATDMLTPQQIYEIDTLTLQQKIQQLQSHPNKQYYFDVLHLAKLQLLQRHVIENWANTISDNEVNQQVTRFQRKQQVILPPVKTSRQINFKKCKPIWQQQIIQKMKSALVKQSIFCVGKPTIRNTPTVNSIKKSKHKAQAVSRKSLSQYRKPSKNSEIIYNVKKMSKQPMKSIQKLEVKESLFSKKEIIKQKIVPSQQIKLKFIQNDIYQKEQMKIQQQNLEEIAKQADIQNLPETIQTQENQHSQHEQNKQQTINTEIDQCLDENEKMAIIQQNNTLPEEQQILKPQETISIQNNISKPQQNGQNQQQLIKLNHQRNTSLFKSFVTFQYQQNFNKPDSFRNSQFIPFFPQQKQENKINQNNETDKIKSTFQRKQKIHSFSNITKKPLYSLRTTHAQQMYRKDKQQVDKLKILTAKQEEKPKEKTSATIKMVKKKIPQPKQSEYHYTQYIQSFSKLFPNSKNILQTLRNWELQLASFCQKNISKLAASDNYMKMKESQLTFKLVSETDKTRKYKHLTNLNLTSYFQRSDIMMKRIKGSNRVCQDMLNLYRVVRTKEDVYDIVSSAFHRTENWFQLPHGTQLKAGWNLLWTWSKPLIDYTQLFYFQKVNHFFGNKEIARKDLLKKNIEKIKKLGKKAKHVFDIIPQTYFLPSENLVYVKRFKQCDRMGDLNIWIMKPIGLSRGRGIEVVNKLEDIVFSQPIVVQKYLQNPLLLDGFKFDMRIYVLVTSMNPLQAYIYNEGFARLSTLKYSEDLQSLKNKFVHLTNFSIQKDNISDNVSLQKQIGGCKISLKMLRQKLQKVGIQWNPIQIQIEQIVLKSLIACMNAIPSNPNCFELFGYDIIIDSNIKCWLLEVNSSPSLEKDFILDEIIKQQLVDDTIRVVNPLCFDRNRLLEVVSRKRKQYQGLKSHITTSGNSLYQLNEDIGYILHKKEIQRSYEIDCSCFNYTRIAPGKQFDKFLKVVQAYKIQPLIKNQ